MTVLVGWLATVDEDEAFRYVFRSTPSAPSNVSAPLPLQVGRRELAKHLSNVELAPTIPRSLP